MKIDWEKETFQEKWQRKFYLMSSEASSSSFSSIDHSNAKNTSISLLTSYFKKDKTIAPKPTSISLSECFQIEFAADQRNIVYLAYAKEVFIFDLVIHQTVGVIQLDKTSSSFVQVFSCSQSDGLFLLHENGLVTFHLRHQQQPTSSPATISRGEAIGENFNALDKTHVYSVLAHSDQIRLSKSIQVYGFSVCPTTQKFFTVLLSDGRVLKYELFRRKRPEPATKSTLGYFKLLRVIFKYLRNL